MDLGARLRQPLTKAPDAALLRHAWIRIVILTVVAVGVALGCATTAAEAEGLLPDERSATAADAVHRGATDRPAASLVDDTVSSAARTLKSARDSGVREVGSVVSKGKEVVDAASTGTRQTATPTNGHRPSSSKIDKTGSSTIDTTGSVEIDKAGSVKITTAHSVKINKATPAKINNEQPSRPISAASPKIDDHANRPKINKAVSVKPDNEAPAITKPTTTSEPATSGTHRSRAAHPKSSVSDGGGNAPDATPVRPTVNGTVRSTTDAVGPTLAAVDTVSKDSVAAVNRTVSANRDRSTDGPTSHGTADRDRSTHTEDHSGATSATDATPTGTTATDTTATDTTATASTATKSAATKSIATGTTVADTANTIADIDADVDTTTDAPAQVGLKISGDQGSPADAGKDLAGDEPSGSRTTSRTATLGELADSTVLAPTAATVSSLAELKPASTLKDATTGLLRSTTEPSRLVPQLVDTVDAVSPEPAKPVISPLVGSLGETTAQLTAPVTDLAGQTVDATAPVLPVRGLINEVTGVIDVAPTEPIDQTVSAVLDPVSETMAETVADTVTDTGDVLPSLPVANLPLPGIVDDGGPLSTLPIIGTEPGPGAAVDFTGTGPVATGPTAPDDATDASPGPLTAAPDSRPDGPPPSSQPYDPSPTRMITRAAAASGSLITPPSLTLPEPFLRAATTVDGRGPAHRLSGSSAQQGQTADAGLRGHGLGSSAPTPTSSGTSGSASGGSGAGPTQPFGTSDALSLARLDGAQPLAARHDAATVRAAHDPGFSPD